MDLRRFVLILCSVAVAGAAPTRSYPLDERSVYTIRLSREAPTTCLFPAAVSALVGANVSARIEDNPAVLLSHEPGAEHFSLRALADDARGALNVLFRGRIYALSLTTEDEPDRAVIFRDEPLTGGGPRPLPATSLRALLDRARQRDRAPFALPGMEVAMDRAEPRIVTPYRNFTATIETVTRFEAEDAVVFRLRLENRLDVAVPYDPQGLAIRLDREFFPAALAEASGAIPARGVSLAYVIVSGGPHGRANLTVQEKFSAIVPRP